MACWCARVGNSVMGRSLVPKGANGCAGEGREDEVSTARVLWLRQGALVLALCAPAGVIASV